MPPPRSCRRAFARVTVLLTPRPQPAPSRGTDRRRSELTRQVVASAPRLGDDPRDRRHPTKPPKPVGRASYLSHHSGWRLVKREASTARPAENAPRVGGALYRNWSSLSINCGYEGGLIDMPYANMKGSALTVILETANDALENMIELANSATAMS